MKTGRFPRASALLALAFLAACSDDTTEPPGTVELSANVSGLSFGVKEAGDEPVVRTFTITNEGTAMSNPLVVTIEGTGAEYFEIEEPESTCVDLELSPGETCIVSIEFGGPGAGPQSASAFVNAGDGLPRMGVTLNGILQATLNVFVQGTGSGGVRALPDGPQCTAVCSLTFVVPSITLTPAPAAGSRFVEWIGAPGCATNEQCTMTLTDLNTVTVRFDLQ